MKKGLRSGSKLRFRFTSEQEETITRDVSCSGIYFQTDQSFAVGDDLNFSLELIYVLPGKQI